MVHIFAMKTEHEIAVASDENTKENGVMFGPDRPLCTCKGFQMH